MSASHNNHLLYDREQQLIEARDGLLYRLELNYINYIRSVLLMKWFVAESIRRQYDDLIRHNTSVYAHMLMKSTQIKDRHPITPPSETATPSTNISIGSRTIHSHHKPDVTASQQRALNLRSFYESSDDNHNDNDGGNNDDNDINNEEDEDDGDEDDMNDDVSSVTSTSSSPTPPFMAHMTIEEAEQLSINDRIDHRDIVGCSITASVVDKKGSNLKISYPEWGDEWDIWCDYHDELYKFARYKSVSGRRSHRLLELKEGDLVDVNPIRHKGWKIGEIKEFDPDSGQLKIAYTLDDYCHYVWTHMDNANEIEALHTFTQQNIDNMEQHKYQSASFVCIYCEYSFTSNRDLRYHVQSDHPKRPYLCKYCPYSANSRIHTERHENQHTQDEPHKCTLCAKLFECSTSFERQGDLTAHLRRVHKVTEYDGKRDDIDIKPDIIKTDAAKKGSRRKKRSYYCIHCEDSFRSEDRLRKHVQKKHSERKYHCKYCPQAFLNHQGMQSHQAQHTVKRQFECEACRELYGCHTSYATLSHYSRHLRRVHKMEGSTSCATKSETSVSGHKRRKSVTPVFTDAPVPKKMRLSQIIAGSDSVSS